MKILRKKATSENIVVNAIRISQKKKNKSELIIEKKFMKGEKVNEMSLDKVSSYKSKNGVI